MFIGSLPQQPQKDAFILPILIDATSNNNNNRATNDTSSMILLMDDSSTPLTASIIATTTKKNQSSVSSRNISKRIATTTATSSSSNLQAALAPPLSTTKKGIEERVVIVLIAMGTVSQTNLTERCIWSLQQVGRWQGPILVITDQASHYSQRLLLSPSNNTNTNNNRNRMIQVAPAKRHHLRPMHNGTEVRYKLKAMIYKRVKTLVLDYVEEYYNQSSSISDWQHVLYMDVDVVVAQPLHPFLERVLLSKQHPPVILDDNQQNTISTDSSYSALGMFHDCCTKRILNAGIIWMHRYQARYCLQRWRFLFAKFPSSLRDQALLRKVKDSVPNCHLQELMPRSECLYPNARDMEQRLLSTFVHNTNTWGSTKIPEQVQERYFAQLLNTTRFSKVEHY
jgi:hypothetical protein